MVKGCGREGGKDDVWLRTRGSTQAGMSQAAVQGQPLLSHLRS